jgi:hypothetical protein
MTLRVLASMAVALTLPSLPALAAEEKLFSHLAEDGKTLFYTPCPEEEWGECVTMSLHCRGDSGFGDALDLVITGGPAPDGLDVRKMAKTLIDQPFGEARVPFIIGAKTVDLAANVVTVSTNEMMGDWDLSLHFMDDSELLDRLDASTADLKADVAGSMITLAADKRDAENLARLAKTCLNAR